MNNTYEKLLFNSFSHMLFIAFVSFNGFFIYLPQFLFSTFRLFFIYYNNLHLESQWFFYISAFISTFLPYFLLYSAVINAPLPFPACLPKLKTARHNNGNTNYRDYNPNKKFFLFGSARGLRRFAMGLGI